MRKIYYSALAALALLPYSMSAQKNIYSNGSVTFRFDNSKNQDRPIGTAYIILDRFDLTGAGIIKEKYYVIDNEISLQNLPVGKYYADVFIKGFYKQYFSKVIKVTNKEKTYTFKLSEVGFYNPRTVAMPKESNDYSKTSVVLMK